MTAIDSSLAATLKKVFGFDTFRPLQREIISESLAGRDVFALLPTGGGKSLCFQLPALVRPGLTVVVSPLIALMKDQVDALQASGVAATFLNSSLAPGESRERLRKLHNGDYRLLYAAPERLMIPGVIDDLKRWKVSLLAIDEAHCISEWGHDFRPEYRQIAGLRKHFPGVPVMALTATATERVRADIIAQLELREPRSFVASFNRPNLHYRVVPKSDAYSQLLEFVRKRPRECGIVYCQSRKSTESVAARLQADGIEARPYHAGLTPAQRSSHQELFLRDDVRVICATIAFGMGINKPNVRYVVHYDLPKNVEGYYQETGRAGRDGLPSECLLLFSAGDVMKQTRFIDEKPDPEEQAVARQQLRLMVHYAESSSCRRSELLRYFGEIFPGDNCGACDNCVAPRETFDGTLAAQKFISCVYRIREKSGFGVGVNHVVEVLTGAQTEKIRRWGHEKLSTYGIGTEHTRPEWAAIAREIIRLGYLSQTAGQVSVLEITALGRETLNKRQPVQLTRPMTREATASKRAGEIACDEILFERLRQLRRTVADAQNVPAYIVFSDVTLRHMARKYPVTENDLGRISGVGERKRREFGELFLREIREHLKSNPRQIFADDSFNPPPPPRPRPTSNDSIRETLALFRAGRDVAAICAQRRLSPGTVIGHLVTAIETGESIDLDRFVNERSRREIDAAFDQAGDSALSPVRELLGERFDFDTLRLCRAARQAGRTTG